jgi:lysophospholipase L1-like esterase
MTLSNSLLALSLAFVSVFSMGCAMDASDLESQNEMAALADDNEEVADESGEDENVAEAESELIGECNIQPFGDSITMGYGAIDGYRGWLVASPPNVGAPVRMSGLSAENSSPWLWSVSQQMHSGYPGYRVDQLTPWIQTNYVGANAILVHAGTNDLLQGQGYINAAYDLEIMIRWLIVYNPTARIIVAKIIPFAGVYAFLNGEVAAYNASIDGIVYRLKVEGYSKVDVVDMNTNFPATTLFDGIHPDATGYVWMANRWRERLNTLGCF